jgi:hypothetical protein
MGAAVGRRAHRQRGFTIQFRLESRTIGTWQ